MNPHVVGYLEKARSAVQLARVAVDGGFVDGAINRAYYGAFYAASAALLAEGEAPRTHTGVHNRFRLLYVKSGRVSAELGKVLPFAFDMRQKADYDALTVFDTSAAHDLIQDVARFVDAVDGLLNP